MPLTRVRRRVTNTGDIRTTHRRPDEAALIRRIAPDGRLLLIGDDFGGEAGNPHDDSHDRDPTDPPALQTRDDGQRSRNREQHPEPLQRPGHEEPERIDLDLVEPPVTAVASHPTKQIGAEAQGPYGDHRCSDHRSRVEVALSTSAAAVTVRSVALPVRSK